MNHERRKLHRFEKIGGNQAHEREIKQGCYMPALLFVTENLLSLPAGAPLLLLEYASRLRPVYRADLLRWFRKGR